jgi:hypothetical protein
MVKCLFKQINKPDYNKTFTLVATFSRGWCVKPWFDNFQKQKFDRSNCHLLLFDNTDNAVLAILLKEYAEKLKKQFASVVVYKSYRKGSTQLINEPNLSFKFSKLPVIFKMHCDIVRLVKTKVFIIIEDDTLPKHPKTIPKLRKLLSLPNCVLASAVEAGRNPYLNPVGVGVHQKVVIKDNKILLRFSFPPFTSGVIEADATGFYCFATYTNLYKKTLQKAKKHVSKMPRWGMDTYITNLLKNGNKKIYVDFSLWCWHMQLLAGKIYFFDEKDAVADAYIYIKELKDYLYFQSKKSISSS